MEEGLTMIAWKEQERDKPEGDATQIGIASDKREKYWIRA